MKVEIDLNDYRIIPKGIARDKNIIGCELKMMMEIYTLNMCGLALAIDINELSKRIGLRKSACYKHLNKLLINECIKKKDFETCDGKKIKCFVTNEKCLNGLDQEYMERLKDRDEKMKHWTREEKTEWLDEHCVIPT